LQTHGKNGKRQKSGKVRKKAQRNCSRKNSESKTGIQEVILDNMITGGNDGFLMATGSLENRQKKLENG
jgi:hypothetical protein